MGTRATSKHWTRRAIAFHVIALSGCSLFVSLDDLTNGNATTFSPDGSIDANESDVVVTNDVVAIDPSDAGDAGVCTGFCDNFDDRSVPVGAWDSINQFGDGDPANLSLTTDEYLSPPQSLHLHVPAKSALPASGLYLVKQFPMTGAKISIDFDMKIVADLSGFDGYSNLMEVSFSGNYAGSVTIGGSANVTTDYWVEFPDGGHLQPSFTVVGQDDQSWHHVHYAALFDPTNGSFVVTWDETAVANVGPAVTYAFTPDPNTIRMNIGYTSQPSMPAMEIYYDNVEVQ